MNSFSYKDILNEAGKTSVKRITDEESKRLKDCLFQMAVDLDERCRKHHLKLFLVGGSLLGAVRHGGFIPWDDDMDFGMLRKDYETLKKVFDKDFSDLYELRCPNSAHPNGNRFMQIYKKGTVLKTVGEANPFQPQSVFVDIFPYDFVPDNALARCFCGIRANALIFVASCVMDEYYMSEAYRTLLRQSKKGALFLTLRRVTGKLFSFRKPEKWFDTVDHAIKDSRAKRYVTSATGRKHYFKEMYPCDVFAPFTEIRFETHDFYAPSKCDVYLTGLYGSDYMTPPDESKRESHFITELSL